MKQTLFGTGSLMPWSTPVLALVLGALTTFSGCKPAQPIHPGPQPSRFQATELTTFHVRRVVMLPLDNMTAYESVGHEFSKLLAEELRTKGAFDLITIGRAGIPNGALKLARDGLFDDQLLAMIGRKYHADAVIVGRISHFHPYWPPSLSVSLHCVDARDGTVLASVDGNWDARNEYVSHQAERFYGFLHPHKSLPHSELVLYSPSYFQKFVAYQITKQFFHPSHWTRDPTFVVTE
jgi:hypothetical protein